MLRFTFLPIAPNDAEPFYDNKITNFYSLNPLGWFKENVIGLNMNR